MPALPELALTCRVCGWRPGEDQEMQVVKDHFDAEHDGADIALEMSAYCPRDDVLLSARMTGVRHDGLKVTTYDCPTCSRTYQVRWSGTEPRQ